MKSLAVVWMCLGALAAGAVADTSAAQESSAVRTWTDNTGDFQVDAQFVGLSKGIVKLKRNDGKVISVPLDRLGQTDQQWVRDRIKADVAPEAAVTPKATPAKTGPPLKLTPVHVIAVGERVLALAISPDGKTIAAGGGGGTGIITDKAADVHLWRMDGQRIARLKGHPGRIRDIAFAPNGKTFVSVDAGSIVQGAAAILWDAKQKKPRAIRKGGAWAAAFSPDSRTMVLAGSRDVELWNTLTGKGPVNLPGRMNGVRGISISPDGKYLACGANDKKAYVWDLKQKQLLKTFEGFNQGPSAVGFSPDGASLAVSGFFESRTTIYDTKQWKEIGSLETARELAYSPDGRFLCILEFGKDGVSIFHTESYKLAARLAGHNKVALAIAFSRDGKRLVTGDDASVRIWDVSKLAGARAP